MYNSFNSLTLFILQRLLIAQADNWLLFCHLTSEIISTRICSVLSSIYIHMQKKTHSKTQTKLYLLIFWEASVTISKKILGKKVLYERRGNLNVNLPQKFDEAVWFLPPHPSKFELDLGCITFSLSLHLLEWIRVNFYSLYHWSAFRKPIPHTESVPSNFCSVALLDPIWVAHSDKVSMVLGDPCYLLIGVFVTESAHVLWRWGANMVKEFFVCKSLDDLSPYVFNMINVVTYWECFLLII